MSAPAEQIEDATTTAPAAAGPRQSIRDRVGNLSKSVLARGIIAMVAGSCLTMAALLIYLNRPQAKTGESAEPSVTAEDAIAAFDAGSLTKAARLAKVLLDDDSIEPDATAAPSFILGAIAADDAERLWGRDQRRYFKLASRYLKDANKLGFPPGHQLQGEFLLGKSLLLSGQIEEGREVLQQALATTAAHASAESHAVQEHTAESHAAENAAEHSDADPASADHADHSPASDQHFKQLDPQQTRELHRLLSLAFMSEPNPRLQTALKHNSLQLEDTSLSTHEQQEALLMRAQILFQLGDDAQCQQTLAKIDPATESGVEALVVHGELLMREARSLKAAQAEATTPQDAANNSSGKYKAAIAMLRRAQNRGTDRDRVTRRSMYLIGQCFLEANDPRAALSQFQRTREAYPDTEEGIAAGVEEAELSHQLDGDKQLLEIYLAVLAGAGPADTYHNPLLPLDKLRSRLLEVYRVYLNDEKFSEAAQLAKAMQSLLEPESAVRLQAQAHAAWAETLKSQATKTAGPAVEILLNAAREQFRAVGDAHANLAKLRFATSHYSEDIWDSAQGYLAGKDYERASAQLREYLKYELRRRRPSALLGLGDAQLSLGFPRSALITLNECILDYPRDPASYRARLLAAKAHVEQGELQQAKDLLLANLEGTELTPQSTEWRDSLFALGALLQDEGQLVEAQGRRERAEGQTEAAETNLQRAKQVYEETIRRLEEAVARYPDVPQVVESRYVIAESYRASARFPRDKLEHAKIETARLEHAKELQRLLLAAIAEYEQVQDLLTRRREESQLTAAEQSILRNCYFARGAAHFELKRFEDAITAYSAATNRYQNEPEVLDAFLQLAACYRSLQKPEEARGVIEQAKVVLSRIREDAVFEKTTIHSREEWSRVLDWLASL